MAHTGCTRKQAHQQSPRTNLQVAHKKSQTDKAVREPTKNNEGDFSDVRFLILGSSENASVDNRHLTRLCPPERENIRNKQWLDLLENCVSGILSELPKQQRNAKGRK